MGCGIALPGYYCRPLRLSPAELSAHLAMRRKMRHISARGRKDRQLNNSALNEESRKGGTKQNAKSHQCPGQPGAAQTRPEESERLPRTPFETFPLRQRRDHERPVLGLS